MSLENTEEVETTENAQSEQEPQEQIESDAPEVEETADVDDSSTDDEDPDTFPRDYVEKLRDENAKYRQRAQKADDLAHRLHNALTAATGRLADPSDLPYEESHLDDPEALETAISELLAKKPHLGSRKPAGNIGQGVSSSTDAVDLAAMMRARA
ncbi:hypothetical protein [Brevibacterium renqingii]|uniref:hypothetical protein n=1 Tax=Brevibacterium renqingii TaxID=2776916 RepID=UPI001ADFDE16|nr:hypothetical protein [Brevibacterium renqingii]